MKRICERCGGEKSLRCFPIGDTVNRKTTTCMQCYIDASKLLKGSIEDGYSWCYGCCESHPTDEFYAVASRNNDPSSKCKAWHSLNNKAKRKAKGLGIRNVVHNIVAVESVNDSFTRTDFGVKRVAGYDLSC